MTVAVRCRLCGNPHLVPVLDLGAQVLSGVFPAPAMPDPAASPLELLRCTADGDGAEACGLLQLRESADVHAMYGASYGYRSSTSPTMRSHLKRKADALMALSGAAAGDVVLDIGCNDGTLLHCYDGRGFVRIGCDPSSVRFRDDIAPDVRLVTDFFSADRVAEALAGRKCRIVTSIAMFYDLEDPQSFADDIAKVLAPDGLWRVELSYLPLLLRNLTYDQICHEHLTYFGLKQMVRIASHAGLEILDVELNEINGGSFDLTLAHRGSGYSANRARIDAMLADEAVLDTLEPYRRLERRVDSHRTNLREFLELARAAGRTVIGYGASTKGNIVLNHCGIGPDLLPAICDKQPAKHGLVTPGSRIPIISQEEMRRRHPDYLLVLIWHLRGEVIADEVAFIRDGGKLVLALPQLHVVDAASHRAYLDATFDDLAYAI